MTIGEEYWMGFAVYVPKGVVNPRGGVQFHGSPDKHLGEWWRNPPGAFGIGEGQWRILQAWCADRVNNVKVPEGAPRRKGRGKTKFDGFIRQQLGPVRQGEWTEVVLHFRVAYDRSGFMEIWIDGKKVWSKRDIGNAFNDDRGPYIKIGIYHSRWRKTPPPTKEESCKVLYFDELRLGDRNATYADVAPSTAGGPGRGANRPATNGSSRLSPASRTRATRGP